MGDDDLGSLVGTLREGGPQLFNGGLLLALGALNLVADGLTAGALWTAIWVFAIVLGLAQVWLSRRPSHELRRDGVVTRTLIARAGRRLAWDETTLVAEGGKREIRRTADGRRVAAVHGLHVHDAADERLRPLDGWALVRETATSAGATGGAR